MTRAHCLSSTALAAFLAAIIALQPAICFAQSAQSAPISSASAAVQPFIDGDADEESRDIAEALSSLLRLMTDHRIIDSITANKIATYHDATKESRGAWAEIASLLARSKEHYFSFRYPEALEGINRVISMLENTKPDTETGPLLLDAFVSKALVLKSHGTKAAVLDAINHALSINPLLDLASNDYPPSLVQLFEEAKAAGMQAPKGSLAVKSNPEGADVYLNGIRQGVTPLKLSDLPSGAYGLTISANRYRADNREITISSDKQLAINSRLKWMKQNKGEADLESDDILSKVIRNGVDLSHVLKVDRLILVDADKKGENSFRVSARMIDGKLGAGLKPVVLPEVTSESKNNRVAEMAGALASQLNADLLSDPARLLDPVGQGDPVLMANRKKPLVRRPLFWGAIGIAVAGALAGGIAAAMSGGSKIGTVKVSFK
jgi:hypothetical protein